MFAVCPLYQRFCLSQNSRAHLQDLCQKINGDLSAEIFSRDILIILTLEYHDKSFVTHSTVIFDIWLIRKVEVRKLQGKKTTCNSKS